MFLGKLNSKKNLPMIYQSESAECGLACICMIANYHGHKIDLFNLRKLFPTSLRGSNLKQIINIANNLSLSVQTIKVELESLNKINKPSILHWDLCHFVVLKKSTKKGIIIHDPGRGIVNLSWNEVNDHFTGIALQIFPLANFDAIERKLNVNLTLLWSSAKGLFSTIFQIFLLSSILQLFIITTPLLIQTVLDNILQTNDEDLLFILGIGFILLLLIRIAIQFLRGNIILYFRMSLNTQILSNLYNHLLHLPLGWFTKRSIGDITSRFNSIDHIRDLLSEGFVEGIVDGMMALITLSMMMYLSIPLSLLSLISVGIYLLSRMLILKNIKLATAESLSLKATTTGLFFESLKNIQSIKVFSGESVRHTALNNFNTRWLNSEYKLNRLTILRDNIKDFTYGLTYLLIVLIAAYNVIEGNITVGMLVAFLSYQIQFANSTQTLVDKLIEWKLLALHLSRIADISLEKKENYSSTPPTEFKIDSIRIEVSNLSYQYSSHDRMVLENVNFSINSGECVAIIGPSGCGKTTLMKLMMGLVPTTGGRILINNVNINDLGVTNFRNIYSGVLQDDRLLSGSVSENITFFSNKVEMDFVIECSKKAQIYDDIMNMPMKFDTIIGDTSSNLSGGQEQRILLARALYKSPKILFLDEASSALDIETEKKINIEIRKLGITTIMISHRFDTIKMADRIIDLENFKKA